MTRALQQGRCQEGQATANTWEALHFKRSRGKLQVTNLSTPFYESLEWRCCVFLFFVLLVVFSHPFLVTLRHRQVAQVHTYHVVRMGVSHLYHVLPLVTVEFNTLTGKKPTFLLTTKFPS